MAGQLGMALDAAVDRRLFGDHVLRREPTTWPEWRARETTDLYHRILDLWRAERATLRRSNEAQTEDRFVQPVLRELGHVFEVQVGLGLGRGRRIPDYAVFAREADRVHAAGSSDAFGGAVAVCDAKRFGLDLDARHRTGTRAEDPVAQITEYVLLARVRWGVLTNGGRWRLYAAEGDLVGGATFELDLERILEAEDEEAFRLFAVMFGAQALRPGPDGRCRLDGLLDVSRRGAVTVGAALERQVLDAVPLVAEGLLGDDRRDADALAAAFDHALVVLYRVLFCLNAETRGLLPVENPHYARYGLAARRLTLAADLDGGAVLSARQTALYDDLQALFAMVDEGDDALGVNEYDGGLFAADRHPWLAGRSVPDVLLAPALDRLFRVRGRQVDYRELSIRHLGTIFEKLLAYRLAPVEDGAPGLRLVAADGRRRTGANFTPEHVVDDVVERTLAPLVDARSADVAARGLRGGDALAALLDLHVVDPAMGSGHFLLGAAHYLARRIATDPSYDGDLALGELEGLVVERCLYGVDVNPMAVEIARLALWLHTVQGDRPLRFLGNLRSGSSVVQSDLRALLEADRARLLPTDLPERAREMLTRTSELVRIDPRTAADAHAMAELDRAREEARGPLLAACAEAIDPPVDLTRQRPMQWELEFADRFLDEDGRLREDGGFDAVIGNPPYVQIQSVDRDVAEHLRARYATASGSFDLYVPFVELGLRLLRPTGRLGFVTSSSFLKQEYGARLRARLATGGLVEEIVDFGDAQLFEGATNYTAILVLTLAGREDLAYVRVRGTEAQVRRQLVERGLPTPVRYRADTLGRDPWILLPAEEEQVMAALRAAGRRLDDPGLTEQIFQGLITSADAVYIVRDLGARGPLRRVRTRDGGEWELEPDLLRPLARGPDVEPYALRTPRDLLLFPYERAADGAMRLVGPDRIAALPRTSAYLTAHEHALRARERGKMDRDDAWWAYVYPKSLGLHDRPKLGVAATVPHLEVAADPTGAVAFHNVRVNGILAADGGPSLHALAAFLGSTPADWAFRRGAAPLRGGYFTANKQFIAWLPAPAALPTELDALGASLHDAWAAIQTERGRTLDRMATALGADPRDIAGSRTFADYDRRGRDAVLAQLGRPATRKALAEDPRRRALHDLLRDELDASIARIADLLAPVPGWRREVDDLVLDAFGLTEAQRRVIASG